LTEYNSKTLPLAEYYDKQSKFTKVHGMGSIEDIFDSLCKAIDSVMA
jgi:adenylate kinase